ncbi:MAG: hypothetical protein HKN76_04865 [Saprospiraceae bacterium]|nr:hypothetical protein [Saprospiraceae bacterium]
MKTKILLIILYFCTLAGYILAQNPLVNYQAVLRDATGAHLPDQQVTLNFSFLEGEAGSPIYSETHTKTTNELGLLNLQIGSGENPSGDLADALARTNAHIKVSIDIGTENTEFDPVRLGESGIASLARQLDPKSNIKMSGLEVLPPDVETFAKVAADVNATTGVSSLKVFSNNENGYCTHLDCSQNSASTSVFGDLGHVATIAGTESGMNFMMMAPTGTTQMLPGVFQNFSTGSQGSALNSQIRTTSEGSGVVQTFGPAGGINASLSHVAGAMGGGLFLYGSDKETPKGWFYVDAQDQSNLIVDNMGIAAPAPGRADEEIVYSAVTGGESASYDRGTAELINGEAHITFPSHFRTVTDLSSMTVTVTPLSAESMGIAVIQKTATGFKVKELHKGKGNYAFDYQVMCKRKGQEKYEVIRKKVQEPTMEKVGLRPLPDHVIEKMKTNDHK